ncbi:MAG: ribose-phosphate diphosphokinase [Candidatus Korarchaeota archaeon]|nr:ribose-phosphate diphosphokinase [Candidatus Korarchaeota archaeon]
MIVVQGTSEDTGIARRIAELLGSELVRVEHKLFPDGESYVRVPVNVDSEEAGVVQTMDEPRDKRLFEAALMADALKEAGARRVYGVVPYLAYMRQDGAFRPGEPISIRAALKMRHAAGIDAILVVEPHKPEELEHFPGQHAYVSPMRLLARHVSRLVDNPLVLSPDLGGIRGAREFASSLGADFDYLEKRRDRVTGEVVMHPKSLAVRRRDAIIVDDIISTGGTMALAARMLRSQGARRIIAVCVHALLVGGAMDKLLSAGVDRIVAANTLPVPSAVDTVDVSPLIAQELEKIAGHA